MTGRQGPRVRIAPFAPPEYRRAVVEGGGTLVEESDPTVSDASVLVWARHGDPAALARTVAAMPALEWVQLPSAGVDGFVAAGALTPNLLWTSAKGAYAQPVAEHALALTLALLRILHVRARASSWGPQLGTTLVGARVLVVGAGGIARSFAELLAPFRVRITACRRGAEPAGFADETIAPADLLAHLGEADVVLLAAPLSEQTRGIVGAGALRRMRPDAVLVNVGRGALVDTGALVAALAAGEIAGAALDVTDPEPLPDGHPLWREPRALITPHSADTRAMIVPLLAERIAENVRRFAEGRPLLGVVDVEAGY